MKKLGLLAMGSVLLLTVHHTAALAQTTEKFILDDPMNNATFVNQASDPYKRVGRKAEGGSFGSFFIPSTGQTVQGWKPTGDVNLVCYDLGQYIENGSLEIQVTQYQPSLQNSATRHHVLAMFRTPWGGHHPVEKLDTFWDLHAGTNFGHGFKFLSNTYYSDETETRNTTENFWNKDQVYSLKIVWNANTVSFFRDGILQTVPPHPILNQMQLRYLYVGRDRTVGGDNITGFMNNQYPAMWSDGQNGKPDGPIYFNLVVKEILATETSAPAINNFTVDNLYQNGARLSWATDEAAVCYIDYGPTTAYGKKDTVLGPPASTFTTLLSNLTVSTPYHFRITAVDDAGNVGQSNDFTFTLPTNGIYVFKPVADTYIETDDRNPRTKTTPDFPWLYGQTRSEGNWGWMNLMTALYRDAFLQFNVTGVTGTISQATLRLYGRQTGTTGADLKQFTPLQSDWENNVTWKKSGIPQYINRSVYNSAPSLVSFTSTTAGQWLPLDVTAAIPDQNNNYYFVLQGTGTSPDKYSGGSFDSKESTNNQPELIVTTPTLFTNVTSFGATRSGAAAWGDYDSDGDLDLLVTGSASAGAGFTSKIYRNDNGTFVDIGTTALTAVNNSAVAWGDYDVDNDLDIVLTGTQFNSPGRISKVYRNDNGVFVPHTFSLANIDNGAVAWGDYNNDGYLDILLSGQSATGPFSNVYRGIQSANRTWAAQGFTLPQLNNSSAAWGDHDIDGWADLLLAGTDANGAGVLKIFKNIQNPGGSRGFQETTTTGLTVAPTTSCVWGNFDTDSDLDVAYVGVTNPNTSVYKRLASGNYQLIDDLDLQDLKDGTASWADYDNDGDLDLLVTGVDGASNYYSRLYSHNAGTQQFTEVYNFEAVRYSSTTWGDYDNDGDLDLYLTGLNGSGAVIGRLYRNNSTINNTPPTTPINLSVSYPNGGVKLEWDKSTDDQNLQSVLTYNVMVGRTSGAFDIISPMSRLSDGQRLIPAPGNAGTTSPSTNTVGSYILNSGALGLAPGPYYWKVQAVDNVFKGSAFSANGNFSIAKAQTDPNVDSLTLAQQAIPQTFALSQGYPNPFNPTTRLNLNLPEDGFVKAIVYDIMGQEVARLQEATMKAGYKYLNWDGKNNTGTTASSGTYLVKVIFEGISGLRKETTSRVTLMK